MSSKRRSGYESIDESADDTELEEMSKDGDTADEKQSGCCARFLTSQVYFFILIGHGKQSSTSTCPKPRLPLKRSRDKPIAVHLPKY